MIDSMNNQSYTYENVMEELVAEEIKRQQKGLPAKISLYMNFVEVTTYALNHLPPLYASSEEGKSQQRIRGQKQYGKQITMAVRQGIAAVSRDPLRTSTPLLGELNEQYEASLVALRDLQKFLQIGEVSWEETVKVVKQVVTMSLERPSQASGQWAELWKTRSYRPKNSSPTMNHQQQLREQLRQSAR